MELNENKYTYIVMTLQSISGWFLHYYLLYQNNGGLQTGTTVGVKYEPDIVSGIKGT